MKYIIFDDCFPVIFTEAISHDDVNIRGMKPTSAGFVSVLNDGKRNVYKASGRSISLDLDSKIDDSEVINRMFDFY